ncbi:EamA family transporter, partial [filamentous cyanobacterium CCP5]
MNRTAIAVAQVHLAVFLFGLSGLFGKFLDLPATIIVLGRTGFATLALGIWLVGRRSPIGTWRPRTDRDWLGFGLLGILLAFH